MLLSHVITQPALETGQQSARPTLKTPLFLMHPFYPGDTGSGIHA